MKNLLYDLSRTFELLHDGSITKIVNSSDKHLFKIEIQYLAEMINKDYKFFYIAAFDVDKLYLTAYQKNDKKKKITDINTISKYEPEISGTEIAKDAIVINTNLYNTKDKLQPQAKLTLSCDKFQIYDHKINPLTPEYLELLSEKYRKSHEE